MGGIGSGNENNNSIYFNKLNVLFIFVQHPYNNLHSLKRVFAANLKIALQATLLSYDIQLLGIETN